jgi:hypothetical protein
MGATSKEQQQQPWEQHPLGHQPTREQQKVGAGAAAGRVALAVTGVAVMCVAAGGFLISDKKIIPL